MSEETNKSAKKSTTSGKRQRNYREVVNYHREKSQRNQYEKHGVENTPKEAGCKRGEWRLQTG